MDIKKIAELAKIINENALTKIKITEGSTVIQLEAERTAPCGTQPVISQAYAPPAASAEATAVKESMPEQSGCIQKSPAVGTVYLSSGENADPYVAVGSKVQKGQTLCLIESMKMFSDLQSEYDGTVAEICVENGQTIGVGQPLFVIDQE